MARLKLSAQEREVLSCAQHRGGLSPLELSKLLGRREHTVRYTLNRLADRGIIISRVPFINVYPLGYTYYTVAFSIHPDQSRRRDEILRNLIASPLVCAVASAPTAWASIAAGPSQPFPGRQAR